MSTCTERPTEESAHSSDTGVGSVDNFCLLFVAFVPYMSLQQSILKKQKSGGETELD